MCGRYGFYGFPIGFWGIGRLLILGFLIIFGIKIVKDKNLFSKNT